MFQGTFLCTSAKVNQKVGEQCTMWLADLLSTQMGWSFPHDACQHQRPNGLDSGKLCSRQMSPSRPAVLLITIIFSLMLSTAGNLASAAADDDLEL